MAEPGGIRSTSACTLFGLAETRLGEMQDNAHIQFDEDIGLMVKAREGDQQAYARLYRKYVPIVRSYVGSRDGRAELWEDIVQEVFTRVWLCRAHYQPRGSLKGYLLGIAANVLRENRARSRGPTIAGFQELGTFADTHQASPPSRVEAAEQLGAVRALMAALPAKQRQALELVYLAGLSTTEASRLLGCSDRTVRANCRLGCERLVILTRKGWPT